MKIQEATQTGDQKGLLLTMTALRKNKNGITESAHLHCGRLKLRQNKLGDLGSPANVHT